MRHRGGIGGFGKLHKTSGIRAVLEHPEVGLHGAGPCPSRSDVGEVVLAFLGGDDPFDEREHAPGLAHLETGIGNRLERFLEIGHEPIRIGAIHHPVIEGQ